MRCPRCGGLNRRDARWCGQCLGRFGDGGEGAGTSAPPPARPTSPAAPPPPAPRPGESSGGPSTTVADAGGAGFKVTAAGITWTCRLCTAENPLLASVCSVCGANFADTVREPDRSLESKDPNMAALLSLFLPGAGHAYLGRWPQAIARATVSFFLFLVTAISIGARGGMSSLVAVVFALVSFLWWGIAAHDAQREGSGAGSQVVLKDRMFMYAVMGIFLLMTVLVTLSLLTARG